MKAITLTQPYAQLVANGDKTVAASTLKGVGGKNGYVEALHHMRDGQGVPPGLPLGAIVAVSYIEDVVEIDEALRRSLDPDELGVLRNRAESDFEPLPWKGALGVWEFPDDALTERLARACRAIEHVVL